MDKYSLVGFRERDGRHSFADICATPTPSPFARARLISIQEYKSIHAGLQGVDGSPSEDLENSGWWFAPSIMLRMVPLPPFAVEGVNAARRPGEAGRRGR